MPPASDAPREPTLAEVPEELTRTEILSALGRLTLGLGALVVAVALLAMHYSTPLERFGHAFVERFGVLGVAAGSFLADGVHLPLPPQFFLLAGEAGGCRQPGPSAAPCSGRRWAA